MTVAADPAELPTSGDYARDLLIDYLRLLDRRRDERGAVIVAASRLRPLSTPPARQTRADSGFEQLAKAGCGELFILDSGDLLFFFRRQRERDVVAELDRLQMLFSINHGIPARDDLPSWFAFCDPVDDFARLVRWADASFDQPAAARPAEPLSPSIDGLDGVKGGARAPLTLEMLSRLETALAETELSSLMRRQNACRLAPAGLPQPLFTELSVAMDALAEAVLPDSDLSAGTSLFDNFSEALDRPVLAMLARPEEATDGRPLSVTLHVRTILSAAFLAFDQKLSAARRGRLVIGIRCKDAFQRLDAFLAARDLLRMAGYRMCLTEVPWQSLPMIDVGRLGADFVKIHLTSTPDDGDEAAVASLRRAVARAGAERVVLGGVDSARILTLGWDAGLRILQGRLVEQLLTDDRRRRVLLQLTNGPFSGT